MKRRLISLTAALIVMLIGSADLTLAQYDYGRSSYGVSTEAGIIFSLEAILTNPRNTDNVVASSGSTVIIPGWDDEFAGRIGLGYQWSGGQKLLVSLWNYETDVDASGVGSFELPIGPTLGIAYDVRTEIKAQTADVAVGVLQQATDSLSIDWSAGLRFASFEETTDGDYDTTTSSLVAFKSNEGDMVGVRLASEATYRFFESFSVSGGLGLSFLDGELEARTAAGGVTAQLTDDGRSGTILDFDITGNWHSSKDNVRVSVGWEQSVWEDIAADLARSLSGTSNPPRDRDSVTFSGYKVGVHFRF